jgi:hypothetical protein
VVKWKGRGKQPKGAERRKMPGTKKAGNMANLQVALTVPDFPDQTVTVEAPPHQFKSGTQGFYFRERVQIGGTEYHVQLIVSK